MDGRTIWRVVLGLILVGLLVGVGASVYSAGVAQGIAQSGQVPAVQPGVGYPYYGGPFFHPWGWGFGFGFLHLLFPLFLFFLIFNFFLLLEKPENHRSAPCFWSHATWPG